MFAKALINITVLDDVCKLLKVGLGQVVKIFFLKNKPLYGMLKSC